MFVCSLSKNCRFVISCMFFSFFFFFIFEYKCSMFAVHVELFQILFVLAHKLLGCGNCTELYAWITHLVNFNLFMPSVWTSFYISNSHSLPSFPLQKECQVSNFIRNSRRIIILVWDSLDTKDFVIMPKYKKGSNIHQHALLWSPTFCI